MARRYRRAVRAAQEAGQNHNRGAALVCHPTGTGKTAVIAGLAHCAPEIGNVLILTTREAIRDQLVREVSGNIFIAESKFNLGKVIQLPKVCYAVTNSQDLKNAASLRRATSRMLIGDVAEFATRTFDRIGAEDRQDDLGIELARQRSVLVMTVQMLVGLQKHTTGHQKAAYDVLSEHVDLVVFDEGHYEAAAKYSAAVRGLDKPIVLMSAAPFRNDLKAFQIQQTDIDLYEYRDAVEDGWIRKVEVDLRKPVSTERAFCADVIEFCTRLWGSEVSEWTKRVIIHCDDLGSITRLGEAFIDAKIDGDAKFVGKVVAIHDRYPNVASPGDWRRHSVPAPSECDAAVWIHQYKLLEGIDDHRFQVLAFFDMLGNVRSVIQQIGRVIRRSSDGTETAWVLDHFGGRIKQSWILYEQYDEAIDAEDLAKALSKLLIREFTKAQPEVLYIDRKFRHILPTDTDEGGMAPLPSAEIADEILFDRRVTLKRIPSSTTLDDLTSHIDDALAEEDYEFVKYDVSQISPDTAIYVCAKVENVSFLNTRYFAEPRISARLVMLFPSLGLVATTSTGTGGGSEGLSHLRSVGPDELERIVMPGELGRISFVSSRNTNLGNRVVRRRTISAPSIAEVPPILDEHGHVVSTVTGYNGTTQPVLDDIDYPEAFAEDGSWIVARITQSPPNSDDAQLIRRYVGLTTGRVSEQGPPLRVRAFRRWVESLADQMQTDQTYPEVYGRYAA